jgi:precorrin-2 dehydrogenase/sirohydrochlorin ferrochelatase
MSLFPAFLKLRNRPCLIVGAGEIAWSKITSLLDAEADVHVIATEARDEVHQLAAQGRIRLELRPYVPEDVLGYFLVIAATDDRDVNAAVYHDAEVRNILCNAVDDPPNCDFYFGSIVRRGDLQIAISTNGESPALAQRLRREINAALPDDLGPWLADLGQLRREVLQIYPAGEYRKQLLHTLAQREVCQSHNCPSRRLALGPYDRVNGQTQGYTAEQSVPVR